MIPRTWDRDTVLRSLPWLRLQNADGRNVYIRPKGEHDLSLVDDLTADAVKRMHLGSLSINVRGTNLWTFGTDKNLPYDPEAGINSFANLEVVIPKTVAAGIKIGF